MPHRMIKAVIYMRHLFIFTDVIDIFAGIKALPLLLYTAPPKALQGVIYRGYGLSE